LGLNFLGQGGIPPQVSGQQARGDSGRALFFVLDARAQAAEK
jgi:hypothetical protein